MSQQTVNQLDSRLAAWADGIAQITAQAKNVTLGLISGNRYNNDARVVFRIVRQLQESLVSKCSEANILLCRLDVRSPSSMNLLMKESDELLEPKVEKSALGNWSFVEVPMTVGNVAPRTSTGSAFVAQVEVALQPSFDRPWSLHVVPSRIVGRLCDCNYVLLGPGSCASAQWITQYIAYHEECGSNITGTICASSAA